MSKIKRLAVSLMMALSLAAPAIAGTIMTEGVACDCLCIKLFGKQYCACICSPPEVGDK